MAKKHTTLSVLKYLTFHPKIVDILGLYTSKLKRNKNVWCTENKKEREIERKRDTNVLGKEMRREEKDTLEVKMSSTLPQNLNPIRSSILVRKE
jgi:hypothetical protein